MLWKAYFQEVFFSHWKIVMESDWRGMLTLDWPYKILNRKKVYQRWGALTAIPDVLKVKWGGSGLIAIVISSAALSSRCKTSTRIFALKTTLFKLHSSARLKSWESSAFSVFISQSTVIFSSQCLILQVKIVQKLAF